MGATTGSPTFTNYIGNPNGTDTANFNNRIQYWPSGSVFAYTRGDGITHAEEYNARLQLLESYDSVGNANGPAAMLFVSCPHWGNGAVGAIYGICSAGPTAANNGNLLGYDEYLGSPNATSFTEFSQTGIGQPTIAYDGVNRLKAISDSGGWSRQFAYDAWGNMALASTTAGDPTVTVNTPVASDPTAIYNAKNQRTDAAHIYDTNGNLTATNLYSMSYDAENRLVSESSPMPFSYGYDGNGRRVTKTGAGNTTVYVYNAAGELAAEYNTTPPAVECATCYLSYDHLGSVRMITDANHNIISRHDFLPFGEEIPQGYAGRMSALSFGSADSVTQRFTGKERDAESGLDYFGARYYGSALGRFTSTDPHFFQQEMRTDPQLFNIYLYGRNNPLKFIDPTGMAIELAADPKVREAQITALCGLLGATFCNQYIYVDDTYKKGHFYVGIRKGGGLPDFASHSPMASALQEIVKNHTIVEIHLRKGDEAIPGARSLNGEWYQFGTAEGETFRLNGRVQVNIRSPDDERKYENLGPDYMSNGEEGETTEFTVLGHEFGHVLYLLKHPTHHESGSDEANDASALRLENEVRKAQDPNAATRIKH